MLRRQFLKVLAALGWTMALPLVEPKMTLLVNRRFTAGDLPEIEAAMDAGPTVFKKCIFTNLDAYLLDQPRCFWSHCVFIQQDGPGIYGAGTEAGTEAGTKPVEHIFVDCLFVGTYPPDLPSDPFVDAIPQYGYAYDAEGTVIAEYGEFPPKK